MCWLLYSTVANEHNAAMKLVPKAGICELIASAALGMNAASWRRGVKNAVIVVGASQARSGSADACQTPHIMCADDWQHLGVGARPGGRVPGAGLFSRRDF